MCHNNLAIIDHQNERKALFACVVHTKNINSVAFFKLWSYSPRGELGLR